MYPSAVLPSARKGAYQSGKVGIAGVNHHIGKAIVPNFVLIIVHRIVYPFEVFVDTGIPPNVKSKLIGYRAYIYWIDSSPNAVGTFTINKSVVFFL